MTKNVLEYKDGNTLVGNSIHWEEKVEMGKGRNFGIEFMLEKENRTYYRMDKLYFG